MTERTVLIIAYYFPPMGLSGVQRTLKFVKYLPEFGWKPIVLTTSPPDYYAFDESLEDDLSSEEIYIYRTNYSGDNKKPKTVKFPSYFKQRIGRYLMSFVYQPDRFIKWKKDAYILAQKIFSQHKVDVIFATAPPFTDFILAKELADKYNKPFLVDYRDVWIDNPFHAFPTPLHKHYCEKIEHEILTHTKKAIVVTRHSKEALVKRYGFISHNDISIIPHGYDPDDFAPYKNVKPDRQKFTITHSGLFQDDRSPKYFLKALSNFLSKYPEAKKHVSARFLGLMRKNHLKIVKKLGLSENVEIKGYLKHSEVIENLMQSDVLWFMQNDIVRSPGKLFEYFGASKPILACIPDGVIRKIALDSKAAIATEPRDIPAIERAIESLYNLWKNKNLPEPRIEYIEQFDRKQLTHELSKELALASDL